MCAVSSRTLQMSNANERSTNHCDSSLKNVAPTTHNNNKTASNAHPTRNLTRNLTRILNNHRHTFHMCTHPHATTQQHATTRNNTQHHATTTIVQAADTPYPQLRSLLEKYQKPEQVDDLAQMQRGIQETTEAMHSSMSSILNRGGKIDQLVQKSDTLATSSSKTFKRIVRGARHPNQRVVHSRGP